MFGFRSEETRDGRGRRPQSSTAGVASIARTGSSSAGYASTTGSSEIIERLSASARAPNESSPRPLAHTKCGLERRGRLGQPAIYVDFLSHYHAPAYTSGFRD